LTPEILVFEIGHSQGERTERIEVSNVPPEKIMNMLAQRKVCLIISGGIQERFQRMFLDNNIDVIWGVAGEVRNIIQAYMKGTLRSGMGIVPAL